jgi:hypothetical protein
VVGWEDMLIVADILLEDMRHIRMDRLEEEHIHIDYSMTY